MADEARESTPEPAPASKPTSWAEAQEEQDRFESLLAEDGDWQEATDDLRRGREPEERDAGMSNPA